jgi:IclR family transcriptional regulator, pca regulon regulatory protein
MSNRIAATAKQNLNRRNFITGLARGLAVLQAFADQNEYLTLSEVAKITKVSRASARRCLITLEVLGYVETRGKFFRLAPRILGLTRAYLSSNLLPRVAQPFVERASDALGTSCSVSILQGDDIIYVARSSRRRTDSLMRDVGAHLPAYCTSMGRVLLASLPDDELNAFLKRIKPQPLTPFTITDKKNLKRTILKVREDGYCLSDQEVGLDVRAIAVPVHNAAGQVVAAMHAVVHEGSGSAGKQRMISALVPVLRKAAADMQALLVS